MMITNYENGEGELTIDKSELWPMRNEKKIKVNVMK